MGDVYGYVRVSSRDQNEARQLITMKELGIPLENTYIDKISGKDFERNAYKRMTENMKVDDLLYIKSIDRLGRNYEEIIEQWRYLTKVKQVDLCVIDMPILDTRIGKDLLGTFISDIVLQVLSFVAENERNNIKQRQAEGIAIAKTKGVKFGRPPKPLPENFDAIHTIWMNGEITGKFAAQLCNMPLSTFMYKAKRYKKTPLVGE